MAMPWQLRTPKRRNPRARGYQPKPIAETLPCLGVNELVRIIPHKHGITRKQVFHSSSHPPMIGLRLTCEAIEVTHCTGHVQSFRLKWIRTHFGHPRPAIHCDKCQRPVIKLYNRADDLACRHCKGVTYISRKLDKRTRPALRAHRIETFLALKRPMSKKVRDRLLKKYGEKALMPKSNYRTGTPRHWW